MSLLAKLKKIYGRSEENRMQFWEIVGFIVIPILTLAILFVVMMSLIWFKVI
jgi:hypothetical protein